MVWQGNAVNCSIHSNATAAERGRNAFIYPCYKELLQNFEQRRQSPPNQSAQEPVSVWFILPRPYGRGDEDVGVEEDFNGRIASSSLPAVRARLRQYSA